MEQGNNLRKVKNIMKKRQSKIARLSVIAFAAFILCGEMEVQGSSPWAPTEATEITIDGQSEGVYLWGNADNWSNGLPSGGEKALVQDSGAKRAVVIEDFAHGGDVVSGDGGERGEIDIRVGRGENGIFKNGDIVYIGAGNARGTVNLYSGTHRVSGRDIRIGHGGSDAHGIYNIYGGTLEARVRMYVGSDAGHGEFNVYGGTVQANTVSVGAQHPHGNAPPSGVFNVAGSGSRISVGGDWIQNDQGTLRCAIDNGGVSRIQVDGDVRFAEGSVLDLKWLEESKRVGSWHVMSWDGELKGGKNVKLAPSVNSEVWSFDFIDTTGNGVPEKTQLIDSPATAAAVSSVPSPRAIARTTSVTVTMPSSRSPSTTGRRRSPLVTICSATADTDVSRVVGSTSSASNASWSSSGRSMSAPRETMPRNTSPSSVCLTTGTEENALSCRYSSASSRVPGISTATMSSRGVIISSTFILSLLSRPSTKTLHICRQTEPALVVVRLATDQVPATMAGHRFPLVG